MVDKIKPKKNLGQNFLKNKYTINKIIEILDLKDNECIIEVGPGQGALTEYLIRKTKNYIGVEKDKNLCDLLEEKFININIINEDILKFNFNNLFNKKIRIIGNIPYNISTKLLLKCIENRNKIIRIDFMMQKEFVDRMISEHGNKSYGRLSVLIQLFFDTEKYVDISPKDFYPEPKIYSSFVSLKPKNNIIIKKNEINEFLDFVKKIFNTRRKKIKNCVNVNPNSLYDNIEKRAEELSILEMINLFREIKKMESLYKIVINVKTKYIEEQSNPIEDRYVFSYTVSIKNVGKIPAKLISRHWIITDANEKIEEVRGLGVIGEQPRLKTNESFEYTSGTIINTPVGTMHGTYQMVADNGYKFDAEIPLFSLNTPKILN